jgi:hypothetical protein
MELRREALNCCSTFVCVLVPFSPSLPFSSLPLTHFLLTRFLRLALRPLPLPLPPARLASEPFQIPDAHTPRKCRQPVSAADRTTALPVAGRAATASTALPACLHCGRRVAWLGEVTGPHHRPMTTHHPSSPVITQLHKKGVAPRVSRVGAVGRLSCAAMRCRGRSPPRTSDLPRARRLLQLQTPRPPPLRRWPPASKNSAAEQQQQQQSSSSRSSRSSVSLQGLLAGLAPPGPPSRAS